MRSGSRILVCGVAASLLFAACSDSTDEETSSVQPTAPPAGTVQSLREPVALALEDADEALHSWAVSPERTTVAYVVDDGSGSELRIADADGESTTIGDTSSDAYPIFLSETELVLQGSAAGKANLHYATTDDARMVAVAESSTTLVLAGATTSELVFAETTDRRSRVFAWDRNAEETRLVVEIDHRNGGIDQARVIGAHVVYRLQDGKKWRLRATDIASGQTQELPRHDPMFGFSILGEGATANIAVLSECGRDGDFIYAVDLNDPGAMTDLTNRAHAAGAVYTGDTVQFTNRAGKPRHIDLASGEISDLPPEQNKRATDQTVIGLKDDTARLVAGLPNGNWLVTGFAVDGRTYESVWNRSDAFGGGQSVNDVSVKILFEYDPVSQQLWRISGPPTFASTATVSGSGVSPSWILRTEAMDGFVVYSTGFSGAAYDLEYNLYVAPIPSSLVG